MVDLVAGLNALIENVIIKDSIKVNESVEFTALKLQVNTVIIN